MKRKILMTLGALSLVFCMFTTQGCYDGPGYGGYGYAADPPAMFGPAYVGHSWGPAYVGHPWGYGYAHDGWAHDSWAHGGSGHGNAGGHGYVGAHAVAHEAHGESHHHG